MESRRFAPYAAILTVLAFHATRFDRFWIPHEEGVLAHPAQRVLDGEVPHVDFVTGYSGGLDYMNAAAMRVFGESLLAPRLLLFCVFGVWLIAVYRIARRFADTFPASALTLLAGLSAVSQYPSALPSWYNLFLATFAVVALLKHRESTSDRGRIWLLVAGLIAAVSIGIKIIGLYAIAGALLAFGFWVTERVPPGERPGGRTAMVGAALVLLPFLGAIGWLVRDRLLAADAVELMLPVLCLAASIVVRARAGPPVPRMVGRWVALGTWVGLGCAAGLALLLIPYALDGQLAAPFYGIFVRTSLFLTLAEHGLPGWGVTLRGGAVAIALIAAAHAGPRWRWGWAAGAVVGLGLLAVLSGVRAVADFTFLTTRPWVPVLAGWAAVHLASAPPHPEPGADSATIALLACMMALVSLVQFPAAHDGYVFYYASLIVLTAGALFSRVERWGAPATPVAAALYGLWLVANSLNLTADYTQRLDLPRGGLRVSPADGAAYEGLVATIDSLDPGPAILAMPDIPEVYFLSSRRNPTPIMLDVYAPVDERIEQVRAAVARGGVRLVVISERGELLSRGIDPKLRAVLDTLFPVALPLERFTVRLRPSSGGAPQPELSGTPAPPR